MSLQVMLFYPPKKKYIYFLFLAVEKCFKMHLRPMKAENLKGKYKKFPHLPFFFNLMRFQSLPPFQEDLVWGIWNFKASNSGSEMSGSSKRRAGHQIKFSSPLIVNINQRNFRESREKSTSLCCKMPGVIWLLRLLETRSSHGYPKWKTRDSATDETLVRRVDMEIQLALYLSDEPFRSRLKHSNI